MARWETRPGRKTVALSATEFLILRDLIQERIGLSYQDNKRDALEDKLQPLVEERGFSSFLDYYYLLKYDANEQEWQKVIEALRVPESFFWREVDQLHVLTQLIIPTYFNQYQGQSLRIWSAACSNGEEPLSIVIALNEAGWFERLNIEVIASDISATAIEKAQKGLFRNYAVSKLPISLRDKYFRPQQNLWQIQPTLISRIKWTTANLTIKADLQPFSGVNIIYCRNVFIYFSESTIQRIVNNFFELMSSPGFLFVGVSESLLKFRTSFQLREMGKVFVYVKEL